MDLRVERAKFSSPIRRLRYRARVLIGNQSERTQKSEAGFDPVAITTGFFVSGASRAGSLTRVAPRESLPVPETRGDSFITPPPAPPHYRKEPGKWGGVWGRESEATMIVEAPLQAVRTRARADRARTAGRPGNPRIGLPQTAPERAFVPARIGRRRRAHRALFVHRRGAALRLHHPRSRPRAPRRTAERDPHAPGRRRPIPPARGGDGRSVHARRARTRRSSSRASSAVWWATWASSARVISSRGSTRCCTRPPCPKPSSSWRIRSSPSTTSAAACS